MSDRRWQFSLKWLLALMTLASICLAIGVHFAGFMVVIVAVVAVQVMTMLCADWLIRPENRRALAFATSGSWIVIGCGLFVTALHSVVTAMLSGHDDWGWTFAVLMILAGLASFYVASLRWRKLAPRAEAADHEKA
jgi:MFS family permease